MTPFELFSFFALHFKSYFPPTNTLTKWQISLQILNYSTSVLKS